MLTNVECTHRDGSVNDHIVVFRGEAEKKQKKKTVRAKSSGVRVQKKPTESAKQVRTKATKKKDREDEDASYIDEPRSKGKKKRS